jgi:hypothetical protein
LALPPGRGCAILVNFHVWHRGTRRTRAAPRRPMLKFQFFTASHPSPRNFGAAGSDVLECRCDPYSGTGATEGIQAMWRDSWAYLRGLPSPCGVVLSHARRIQCATLARTTGASKDGPIRHAASFDPIINQHDIALKHIYVFISEIICYDDSMM